MSSPEKSPPAIVVQPASPRFPITGNLTAESQRKVAIAVDLSDESAYAVNWAVQNYLRPDDVVILLHVRPTSVLYGADWGAVEPSVTEDEQSKKKLEDDFDTLTTAKANEIAKPLVDGNINFKIRIVKDHDMKERLCLEVERLGLSAVIMGSRGFGAASSRRKRMINDNNKEGLLERRLGSVSDYCVHHCVCPVVVVRFPDENDKDGGIAVGSPLRVSDKNGGFDGSLPPVLEEEPEFHDASDKQSDLEKSF
ncbi:universal stress protein PHOS32-like [Rutidosis leptorrhynchoides]|uniref:universal stress protein PHOS32-like n=1 Tax=Rutidosis leptorrhynchoides TaxID=125765 RepID=UPI003A9A16D2